MSQDMIVFPMSYIQEQLWFESQLKPDIPAYTAVNAVRLSGQLNLEAFEQSLQEIVKRHEILRTTFDMLDGEPVQLISENAELSLEFIPLTQLSKAQQESEFQRYFAAEEGYVFDLKTGPLMRVTLLQLGDTEYILLLTIHHIITDTWSKSILIRELATFYDAFSQGLPSPLPELPVQYGDYAEWQREWLSEESMETHLRYWKNQLADIPPLLELPADRPRRPAQTYQGARERFVLSAELTAGLKALCQENEATLFMALLAAYATVLSRYSRQEDIVIGSVIATRKRRELESLIGFFLNNLVLRVTVDNTLTFQQLLCQTRQTMLEAYQHQDMPFAHLIKALQPKRNTSYSPLFQTMLVLENVPTEPLELPGLKLVPLEIESMTADYDLACSIAEIGDELVGKFIYNAELFDAETISRMIGHFQTLIQHITTNPRQPLSEISLLSDAEWQQIVVEWNRTEAPYPESCVHELFEAQVEQTPDAVALVYGDQQLTYRELNVKANQLAHYLQKHHVQPEILVGICAIPSPEMIVGILGVLKAGGAFVPLDPSYPKQRLAYMIADSELSLLVTQEALLSHLPKQLTPYTICLDQDWNRIVEENRHNPHAKVSLENLSYVIYTSGSTGKPKGVGVSHRGIPNLCMAQAKGFHVHLESRVLQFASFSFDASISEIFVTFLAGATLILASREELMPGLALIRTLRKHSVTIATFPPSVLAVLSPEDCPTLQTIVSAGEPCSATIANRWAPGRHFVNAYGPTEATVCATINEDVELSKTPSIGYPIANARLYILDDTLQPVPIGVAGELYVGGVGLARGYLKRPELTEERFIPNPFSTKPGTRLYRTGDRARYLADGKIEFLGRLDNQVKLRGFRIELGEIEQILSTHPAILGALAVVREDTPGDKRLIAYIVPVSGQTPDIQVIKKFLQQHLPEYMIPALFITLDAFPITPNGKIDRRALPTPDAEHSLRTDEQFVAPHTPLEKTLAHIWSELLNIERIGIYESFFDLGGHSLIAVTIAMRMSEIFRIQFMPAELFEFPTIATMALHIEDKQHSLFSSQPSNTSTVCFEDEAVLDDAIRPATRGIALPSTAPAAIFFTGATGFLGAFLLIELLHATDATVYCLVRANNLAEAKQRVRQQLIFYELWDESLASRIIPVPGNLSQPLFGLSEDQFNALSQQIDVIYHNGALVNFIHSYSMLKAPNVNGTQEVLRLACHHKTKPVHYVSSLSVFDAAPFAKQDIITEDEPLAHIELLHNGYAQSKWIAEKLVTAAHSRGIPAYIYRPGRVAGHSQTGVWNTEDFACKLLKGCIQLGLAPSQNFFIDLTPADYVSRALVAISSQAVNNSKRIFHLLNPRPLSWNPFVQWINNFGYPLKLVPYTQWRSALSRLTKSQASENALYPLLPFFLNVDESPLESSPQRFDCQHTLDALAHMAITCPSPDNAMLETYFSYFIRTGFLSAP